MTSAARALACAAIGLMAASCVAATTQPPVAAAADTPKATQTPLKAAAGPADFVMSGTISQGGIAIGTAPAGTRSLTLDGAPVPVTGDGRFLVGFGRDFGPSALLVATRADGSVVRRPLTIVPRAWRIEALPIPRGTTPTPEFVKARAAEVAQIDAARRMLPDSDGWRETFARPMTGRISGLFGSQRVYNGEKGSFHGGLDIARPAGTPVAAPADGVVILAADHPFTLEGNLLMIDHGMGLSSAFLHLSRIDVKVGDHVRQGQVVGAVGMTGRATGPHLHWGLRWREQRLDPLLLMGDRAPE